MNAENYLKYTPCSATGPLEVRIDLTPKFTGIRLFMGHILGDTGFFFVFEYNI